MKQMKKRHCYSPRNVKITPLGGLNEIGKNMTVIEYGDEMIIIDCGLSFPENEMLGIDIVIPDFQYIIDNQHKLKGLVITHGHEDHIGAIPYLLKMVKVPLYGTKLTLGLVENKLKEHRISAEKHVVSAGDVFKIGSFEIETIRATHSIADAIALYIKTPCAKIFHTGDFKIDYTPVDGEPMDFGKLAEIGEEGVDLLLADSTNALKPGFTRSEKVVGETLEGIFRQVEGRIIIATFSSNVHRVQKIIDLAVKYGRKVAVSGRSMDNVVKLATNLGYLNVPANSFVDLRNTRNIQDKKLIVITTGSQGEPMAALSRMANDEHKTVKIKPNDTVIFSSTPVPGNEKTVSNVVNRLYEKGADVIYHDIADIHVSGHACQEELKIIHSLIKPKHFMPVHGETRHLIKHAELAENLGMNRRDIHILDNGDQLTLDKKKVSVKEAVASAEDILVDGLGVGDVGNVVLKERKQLSEAGLITISLGLDSSSKELVYGPELITRGFIYVKENAIFIEEMKAKAKKIINAAINEGIQDENAIKGMLKDRMREYLFQKTKREPMIIPIIMRI